MLSAFGLPVLFAFKSQNWYNIQCTGTKHNAVFCTAFNGAPALCATKMEVLFVNIFYMRGKNPPLLKTCKQMIGIVNSLCYVKDLNLTFSFLYTICCSSEIVVRVMLTRFASDSPFL